MFPKKQRNTNNKITLDMFENKKAVFLSARVHPGELPSSHMLNGLIQFLLSYTQESEIIRKHFVFYIVPILNPDGVFRGHYRTDVYGNNLNRCYLFPDVIKQPSIYFTKELILSLFKEGVFELYIDLHAHATKQGCFFFGNQMDFSNQVKIQLFARLMALHNPIVDYAKCNFTEWNMYQKDKQDLDNTKEGSGRVGIFKTTGKPLCFTLECNYNNGKRGNKLTQNEGIFEEGEESLVNTDLSDKNVQQAIFLSRINSAEILKDN